MKESSHPRTCGAKGSIGDLDLVFKKRRLKEEKSMGAQVGSLRGELGLLRESDTAAASLVLDESATSDLITGMFVL